MAAPRELSISSLPATGASRGALSARMVSLYLAVSLGTTACVPLAPLIWVPHDHEYRSVDWRMCEPTYQAQLFKEKGVVLSWIFRPSSDTFAGTLLLEVPSGTQASFDSRDLTISAAGSTRTVAMFKGGWPVQAQDGYSNFSLGFGIPVQRTPSPIVVILPPLRINTEVFKLPPFTFETKRQAMVVGLCQ